MAAAVASGTSAIRDQTMGKPAKRKGKVLNCLHSQFAKKGNEGFSEYQDRYRWFTFQSYFGKMKKPPTEATVKPKERMDLHTSYDRNYVEHPIKIIPKPKPEKYCPPPGKMLIKSDYQESYIKKEPLPTGPYVPNVAFRIPPRRTDIVSEYQSTYLPCDVIPPKPAKMKERLEISKDKFNEVSTIQHDYQAHKGFKRVLPIYQCGQGIGLGGPFTSITTYRDCYTPKEFKHRPAKGVKSKRRDGPHFTDAIKVDEDPDRPASMPDYVPAQLDPMVPFQANTTQRTDYKRWPTRHPPIPNWVTQMGVKQPRGDMTLNTTYESDFTDPEVVPPVPPMITLCGRKQILDAQVDINEHMPESTHRTHFTGQSAEAARPFYPRSDNWQASTCGKLPLTTTYKECFMGESHKERTIRRQNMKKALERDLPKTSADDSTWKWAPSRA